MNSKSIHTLSEATQYALNTLSGLRNNKISKTQATAEARMLDSISRSIRTEIIFRQEAGYSINNNTMPFVTK